MKFEPTIGLEVHAELRTQTKMFCDCKNDPEETQPNINICPVCIGHPGTLPVINKKAVEMVVKTGLALNCKIQEEAFFERKNYFYPDLPKGYQISQYQTPLCKEGYLTVPNNPQIKSNESPTFENNSSSLEENSRKLKINRVHLEEDTGKLIHPKGAEYSLVDFNRAGVPLMELVTEPDIKSAKEAGNFARELQLILRYLNVSNADMEKGQMRVEVNISLSKSPRIKPNESQIVLKDESYKLMGLLFEIHKKLGSIYKEKNYQDAIEEILKREKISYEREKKITLKFENLKVSDFFADFIIENKILLKVKAKRFITQDDIRQASRYIKSTNLPLAIIANFKRGKLEYKRVINSTFKNNSSSLDDNSGKLGTKVEIKNLNSIKSVEKSIEFEIKRQTELLERGEKIVQETRGWHDIKQETFSQREKEESHDYRYFPEPDLPPLRFSTSNPN